MNDYLLLALSFFGPILVILTFLGIDSFAKRRPRRRY